MRKILGALGVLLMGVYVLSVISIRSADASRNSSGTMSAINGPYVPGTAISSSIINARFADIEAELTDSLSRSGKGGMTAALKEADGTAAAPSFSFTNEAGTGWWRIGAGDLGLAILGTKKLELTSSLFTVTPNASFSGTLAISGATSFSTSNVHMLQNGSVYALFSGFWAAANADSPSTSNYTLLGGATTTQVNAPTGGSVLLNINDATKVSVTGSGLTIGASGTAISGSFEGSASLTPANINAQTCANFTGITVTGAAAGAVCAIGNPSAGVNAMSLTCAITSTNTCTIQACNPTAGTLTPTSGTYRCRAFNP